MLLKGIKKILISNIMSEPISLTEPRHQRSDFILMFKAFGY